MSNEAVAKDTGFFAKGQDPNRWVIIGFVWLFYFVIVGFTNQSFNIFLRTIVEDMGWDPIQMTAVAGAMSTGMIWFVFVAGITMDRISVRKVLGSGIFLSGALIFLRGNAEGFMFWYSIMFMFGVGSAFFMPACTKIIGVWFPQKEVFFANGILTCASPMGQLVANLFAAQIMFFIGGWQMMYTIIGVCVVFISIAFFFLAKERRSADSALGHKDLTEDKLGMWKDAKAVMRSPYVWMYIFANTFFLGTILAGGTFGQFIFQSDPAIGGWGLDVSVSGRIPAFNNFASMFAYLLVPMFIAKIGNHHFPKFAIMAGYLAAGLFVFGHLSYNFWILAVCMAIAGICYGAIIPAPKILMMYLPEVHGPRTGVAMGIYVTIERLGITIFITTMGAIMAMELLPLGHLLGFNYILQFISPTLILIATIMLRKRAAKEKAAATE